MWVFANRDMWGRHRSNPVMILIFESVNPWNPRNPWNPWNFEFSRVAGRYEDIDEWGHVGEASLWPCHDGAPLPYPPPCLSFAYKTIVWFPYDRLPVFRIQNHSMVTIPCHTIACLSFAYKTIVIVWSIPCLHLLHTFVLPCRFVFSQ